MPIELKDIVITISVSLIKERIGAMGYVATKGHIASVIEAIEERFLPDDVVDNAIERVADEERWQVASL